MENRRSAAAHGGQSLPERAGLLGQLLVLDGAFDLEQERFVVERLFLKIVGAQLGGGDGGVNGRVACEDDHFGLRPLLFDLRQQIQPLGIGQL